MTRLLFLCGSQRKASLNARLLDLIAGQVPHGAIIDHLAPDEVRLPLYHGDDESDAAVLAHVRTIHGQIADADALVVASPEFNGSLTPYLKNLIDWVSRVPRLDPEAANAFRDKPVLLAAASPGWTGGALGLGPLRMILGHVGAVAFGEQITLPYADRVFTAAGQLDPAFPADAFNASLADCVARFVALVRPSDRTASKPDHWDQAA